jgi:hypothetical protein
MGRSGKTLGLGVDQTWAYLFQQNEERYAARKKSPRKTKPRTDEEITTFMKEEFPLTPEQKKWLKQNKKEFKAFDYPTAKRSRYNTGKLSGMSGVPKKKSHRYNGDGERIGRWQPRTQVG